MIGKIIDEFQTKELIKLQNYWNYFKGNQKIMSKKPTDAGKPANKVMTNYCYNIVQNYRGYLTGLDITYTSDTDLDAVQDVLNYNDVHTVDSSLLQDALIYGVAYEIAYIDEDGVHRFKTLNPKTVIPVYDNTLNQELAYCIRLYQSDLVNGDEYVIEVYDSKSIKTYRSQMGFKSFSLINEEPHYFGMVPITVFELNDEKESIFAQVMTLQDAYNELLSAEVDDFQSFADAYLVLKGMQGTSPEDLKAMKESRGLLLDSDAEASYLTKSINDTQIQNMLQNINDNIHKIANSPDFNDEKLMAQSGIAMRYKLVGFENASAAIEANMRKALQKRIELICAIGNIKGGELVWRDIKINFTRNLPENTLETAQVVNSLRGLVSDETLLGLLPFITDTQAEMDRLQAQKEANYNMYSLSFGMSEETDE